MASRPQPRILCLDGGGIRGLAEIRILKELMLQVRLQNSLDFTPEPAQCFDYICGTSTGGLVAVLIGRLGKTMDECEALFRDLGAKIFSGGSSWRTARLVLKGSQHNREGLADVIRSQAGQETLHEADASAGGHVP
ncbi:intracellular membrane-bound Ca2+-independent phospholipase A2, partial [Colletotrichum higginsianum]